MNTNFLNGILPSASLSHTYTHTHTHIHIHTSDNKPILTPEWLLVNQRCGQASGCQKEVRGRQMEGMTSSPGTRTHPSCWLSVSSSPLLLLSLLSLRKVGSHIHGS